MPPILFYSLFFIFYLDSILHSSSFSSLELLGFFSTIKLVLFLLVGALNSSSVIMLWFFGTNLNFNIYTCLLSKTSLIHIISVIMCLTHLMLSLKSLKFNNFRVIVSFTKKNFPQMHIYNYAYYIFLFTLVYGAYWSSNSSIGWGWDIIELCPLIVLSFFILFNHISMYVSLPYRFLYLSFYLYILVRTGFYATMHHIEIPSLTYFVNYTEIIYNSNGPFITNLVATLPALVYLFFWLFGLTRYYTFCPSYAKQTKVTQVDNLSISNDTRINYELLACHVFIVFYVILFLYFPSHIITIYSIFIKTSMYCHLLPDFIVFFFIGYFLFSTQTRLLVYYLLDVIPKGFKGFSFDHRYHGFWFLCYWCWFGL